MFILSFIPNHLPGAYDGLTGSSHMDLKDLIKNPDLSRIESRIKSLEALLTAELLQQFAEDTSVSGYDNDPSTSDKKAIQAELELLRQKDIEFRKATGKDSNVDENERLSQFKYSQFVVDERIKDLENLKQAFLTGKPLDYVVSGIDNDLNSGDIKDIDHQIKEVKAYKTELNSLSNFWKTISDGHVGETDNTQNTKPLVTVTGSVTGAQNTDPPDMIGPPSTNNGIDHGEPLPPVSAIDLSNLTDEQKAYYNQIKTNLKYVLQDAEKKDITDPNYSSSFASRMFAYLGDLTGVKISAFNKAEVLKAIENGSITNVDDVIKLWETAVPPPPPPPPKEAEGLVKLTDAIKKLFNDEDPGMDTDSLPDMLANELKKFTKAGGSVSDRMEAIMNFLESGKATDKNGDGEFTYEDLAYIWKNPNKISTVTDNIIKVMNKEIAGNTFKLKKELYDLLSKETGEKATSEKKNTISDLLKKIASGDMSADLNGDGYLDYSDLVESWKSTENSQA